MPTPTELAPQLIAFVAVVSVPVVFAYLGLRGSLQLWLARRKGLGIEFLSKERRWLIPVSLVNLCFTLLFAYGWFWEARWVERVDVEIDSSIPAPIRFVHLSDLHLEGFGKREFRAIELVNSSEPDIIFLTGDYLSKHTGERYANELRSFVAKLEANVGIFAAPGNWDHDAAKWFDGTGVTYLAGKSTKVEVRGVSLSIAGEWFDVAPPPEDPSADFTIYLQHSPDFLDQTSKAGYDLYLAGHTHGGQVRIPGFGAVVTLSRFWKKYESGLFREGPTYLYVNRGLGLEGGWAPRIRLFCRPEVTVIELRFKTKLHSVAGENRMRRDFGVER